MNKQMLELRKKFRGQKAKVDTMGFDNSPIPEGRYTAKIVKSEIKSTSRKDRETGKEYDALVHNIMVKIEVGEHKGRNLFPFSPDLNKEDGSGITACALNIRSILGDVIPGKMTPDGQFELTIDAFLDEAEDLAAKCEGELIEIQVKNQKARKDGSHLNKEGKPRQNVYIQRGLGDDGKAVTKTKEQARVLENIDPATTLNVNANRRKKPVR